MSKMTCEHCSKPVSGKPHRVISEEDGLVLLDMIVCADCAEQAQKLRLKTEELESPEQRQHG